VNKVKTGGALAGGVVTYEAAGKQYVAFASGNVSRNAFGALGVPSVVIMGLGGAGSPPTGAGNPAKGRKVYEQVCASCHGPDGNLVPGHPLRTLRNRRDPAATLGYIKDPKPPMPKLYPDLLNEQSLVDVTSYIYEDLAH
jgi:alcohol dehydrogenase (cytochrome c)